MKSEQTELELPQEGTEDIGAVTRAVTNLDHVNDRIEEYRRRIVQANAEHGTLPLFLATLSFAAVFANYADTLFLMFWLGAVTALIGTRLFLIAWVKEHHEPRTRNWFACHVVVLSLLGALYGVTPFWLNVGSELWLLAVCNLWLAGLAVAVLLSQGIFLYAGLAFAVPTIAPLMMLLLFSGDATRVLIGLGNVLLFTYLFTAIARTRTAVLDETRHRVMFEQLAAHYDEQRQHSDKLVVELTEEVERRKQAEIALREARDAAESMSNRDHLTGHANRRVFDRVLAREWLRSLRTHQPISLIICDIDNFREYNEYYGNRAGDMCLIRIAGIIRNSTNRAEDLAARYSGEQFSILLPETTEEAALEVAENVRQAIHDQTILHAAADMEKIVTASFGVATLVPVEAHQQNQLVEAADNALRRAQRGGGNCVFAIYGDLQQDG